jgi:hypothetical protein
LTKQIDSPLFLSLLELIKTGIFVSVASLVGLFLFSLSWNLLISHSRVIETQVQPARSLTFCSPSKKLILCRDEMDYDEKTSQLYVHNDSHRLFKENVKSDPRRLSETLHFCMTWNIVNVYAVHLTEILFFAPNLMIASNTPTMHFHLTNSNRNTLIDRETCGFIKTFCVSSFSAADSHSSRQSADRFTFG